MTKRIKLKLEEEIEMLYAQLDVKEAMIKNYTAEIETQRQQLAIAVEALGKYANKDNWQNHYTIDLNDWELELKVFDEGEDNNGEFYAQEALQQIKELG